MTEPIKPFITKINLEPQVQLKKTIKFLKKIEYYFRQSISHPEEIENLHKLRVNIRNFYVNFDFLSPFYPRYRMKIINSGLDILKDCTDHIRDIDIFQSYIRDIFEIKKGDGISKNGIESLYDDLTTQRQKYFLELQKIFFDFLSFDLFKYWRSILKTYRKKRLKGNENFQSIVIGKLKSYWYDFESQITIDIENDVGLHHLRIAGKKFRYSFESLKEFFSDETQREISAIMVEIQQNLGAINDSKTILQMLDKKKNKKNSNNPMVSTTISHRYFYRLIQEKKKTFQESREIWLSSKAIEKISAIIYNL